MNTSKSKLHPGEVHTSASASTSHTGTPEGVEGNGKVQAGMPKLRFAALIRVSTDRQEKQGESLRSQTLQLEQDVSNLGGTIVEWYGGSEGATPGSEKREVNRLIDNAQKQSRQFNALIVANHFRWSRDNAASKAGLEVFRQHDIKFYVGTSEHDLWDPVMVLILGQFAEIGEFFARHQSNESRRKRADRARRGVPTSGKLPYGRIYVRSKEDRKTGEWKIDEEKKAIIEDCAKRYLTGESITDLAKAYKMNAANLWKVLTKTAGSKWEIRFKANAANRPDEVIPMSGVPPLLDEETIKRIHERSAENKTFRHGHIKNRYLFARMISCAHCGYAMIGQTNQNGKSYYRHAHAERDRVCPGPATKSWVPVADIEDNAMLLLFDTFGNPAAVKRAMEKAIPNNEKVQETMKRQQRLNTDLDKLKRKRQLTYELIGEEPQEGIKAQLANLKEREQKLTKELSRLENELAHTPSAEEIKKRSVLIAGEWKRYVSVRAVAEARHANEAFNEMTYEEKRHLCQTVFSGKTADGRRMGVWVSWDKDGKKWRYDLEGGDLLKGAGGPVNPKLFSPKRHIDYEQGQKVLVTKPALHSQNRALLPPRSYARDRRQCR